MRPARALGIVALALLAGLLGPGAATPTRQVVGGSLIRIQAAPWTAFVEQDEPPERYICTGSIIDPTHVVTAAHCAFDRNGVAAKPSALTVRAGVSNFSAPLPSDAEQDRRVSAIRVHPGFHWSDRGTADDVAVLVLASPLDLDGVTAKAVALPAPGSAFPTGAPVGVAGFGEQAPTAFSSGPLYWMTATIADQGACNGLDELIPHNAIELCSSSLTSAICAGDSGSALVTTATSSPTLIGVTDAGEVDCRPGSTGLFAYVGAPEILRFIKGSDTPPTAPHPNGSTFVKLTWPSPPVVGDTLTCTTGGWHKQGRIVYRFTNGSVLQRGTSRTFLIRQAEAYSSIRCEVAVTNAGGTTLAGSQPTPALPEAPEPVIDPIPALASARGLTVTLRLTLHSPAGLWGPVEVCVSPPAAVGGRICSPPHRVDGKAATFRLALEIRIGARAPAGAARLRVEAVAGVSKASVSVALRIS